MSTTLSTDLNRSTKRFNDYAGDLISSGDNTFLDRLGMFLAFCSDDPVLGEICQKFSAVNCGTAEGWYNRQKPQRLMVFPVNSNERAALQLKILTAIHDRHLTMEHFVNDFHLFKKGNFPSRTAAFCDSVVEPLCREINYKLEDLCQAED